MWEAVIGLAKVSLFGSFVVTPVVVRANQPGVLKCRASLVFRILLPFLAGAPQSQKPLKLLSTSNKQLMCCIPEFLAVSQSMPEPNSLSYTENIVGGKVS